MRRLLCSTDPTVAFAGERKTWRFVVTSSIVLPKGSQIKFDMVSQGRPMDWQIPEVANKAQSNIIWAELQDGTVIKAKAVEGESSAFEFILPKAIPCGQEIIILVGSPKDDKLGTMAQHNVQRRRPFLLYLDTSGKGHYGEAEPFSIDVRGNLLHIIRILAPSVTTKNRRFDVVLRFEDAFGNLTNNAPDDTLIEFTHENLRDSLKWKLFLPETGFIALPNLYFNEPGVYSLRLRVLSTGAEFISSPIKCFAQETKNIFWGVLQAHHHEESENIENSLRYFRDERSINFFATSLPEDQTETSNEQWKKVSQVIAEFDEEDRFVAFVGQQWHGSPMTEGSRIVVFQKNDHAILRQKETRYATLKKMYSSFSPKECLSIPINTMHKNSAYNFEAFSSEFERLVEIYNNRGSSEQLAKSGNPFPCVEKAKTHREASEGSVIHALRANMRFGFVAGDVGSSFSQEEAPYTAGITAVVCEKLCHTAIFDSLYSRSCYATTGARIILGMTLAGHGIGSEISAAIKPGLHVNRHLEAYVVGTAVLAKIELIRNGDVVQSYAPKTISYDFEYDDMDVLADIVLKDPKTKQGFVFYYLRVTQQDGHMAWSSPIWIDYVDKKVKAKESKLESDKK